MATSTTSSKTAAAVGSSSFQASYNGALSKTLTDMIGIITPIKPYLSVSGCLPVSATALLQENYTCAVCCMDGFEYDFPPDRIEYLRIRITDTRETDLRPHFDVVCRLIDKHRRSGGRTLVFCAQGISRSVSFILAYLMKYEKVTLLEAFDLVRYHRRLACPNVGFFKQLIELERQLHYRQSVHMVEPYKGFEVADIVWKCSGDMLKEFRRSSQP